MSNQLIYMPTFRFRQQEAITLKSFDFGKNMYPLVEIIKEHDRARKADKQLSFEEIHLELINSIKAEKVFVDLPVYLKQTGSVKDEVLSFSLRVSNILENRCEYLNKLAPANSKVIPIISSYVLKTGEDGTIEKQEQLLRPNFPQIGFRLFAQSFTSDILSVTSVMKPQDYVIIDLDHIVPYHRSPPLRPIVQKLLELDTVTKVLLRSAINTDIQNVKLENDQVVFEADNGQIDVDVMTGFNVNATGDFVGIKKDDLTAGGTISPGFIYYDAVENQYYGYRANFKKLEQFEDKIVPDVLNSASTKRMLDAVPPFLVSPDNVGYETLISIDGGFESGKSQAKFKRIAMEHYLYCMRVKIDSKELVRVG